MRGTGHNIKRIVGACIHGIVSSRWSLAKGSAVQAEAGQLARFPGDTGSHNADHFPFVASACHLLSPLFCLF